MLTGDWGAQRGLLPPPIHYDFLAKNSLCSSGMNTSHTPYPEPRSEIDCHNSNLDKRFWSERSIRGMYGNVIMRAVTLYGNKQQKEGEKVGWREGGRRRKGRMKERKKKVLIQNNSKSLLLNSGCSLMRRMQ